MPGATVRTRNVIESMLADVEASIELDAPIGRTMTWYAIGGNADALVRPRTVEALAAVLTRCRDARIAVRVLGSGANLLVSDEGIDGVVVQLSAPELSRRGEVGEDEVVRVMGGASMERLVMWAAREGWSGIEAMAGIPASVGGAVRMNAGGKFGSIGDAVKAIGCMSVDGEMKVYRRDEIVMEYRRTSIAEPVVLWAELRLAEADPMNVGARVKEIFAYKKDSQPMAESSAGCAFKNPMSREEAGKRVSAGALIEKAGLKGKSVGGATISEQHGNFFVARPGAKAADVIALMETAAKAVRERTGYELEREVVVWRRGGNQVDSRE